VNHGEMPYQVAHQVLTADQVHSLLLRYKKSLEGLTPGGSEYVNDPERCAAFVRSSMTSLQSVIKIAHSHGKHMSNQTDSDQSKTRSSKGTMGEEIK
jgi:hypothetical protein